MNEEKDTRDIQNNEADMVEDTKGEIDIGKTEKIIEERKEKIIAFLKNKQIWVIGVLIIAVILGIYIRSLPMTDRAGRPGLWDITTNTWTLGPDLDPWLFERYAETIVEQGGLPKIDAMRNVPLGFDTKKETQLLPYMIVGVYYLINLFGNYEVIFAAVIFPVIMFALTILTFFLFVREVFIEKSKESIRKANIIALISTFFMIVIPVFLSRTIAGIPEKESAAFFFMFLSFYFFLKAWKSTKLRNAVILGVLAGISTGLMGLIWGGVIYVFVTIAVANLIAFILNKINNKEFAVYGVWLIFTLLLLTLLSDKYSLADLIKSSDYIITFITFFIFCVNFILWSKFFPKINIIQKKNLPKNIISLIISIILGILLISLAFGPGFIFEKIRFLIETFINPTTGRWGVTVAENRQPFFTEWSSSFGPFIRNIPVLFWLFFMGSVVLFKNMLKTIRKKEAWILTGLYILFFFGLVFSRYSPTSIFNGENFISKFFYFGSAFVLIGALVYYYIKYFKKNHSGFEKINYGLLFLFSLFILCLFTARSAVRLIMVLAPIAPIFAGYLIIESAEKFRKTKDETWKIILGVVIIILLLSSAFAFLTFYKTIKVQAYNFVPSSYNQQWQKAMKWVREETPKNAVFAHWWDYGYWLQSIGKRATILDGGNVISFWNYYMGRLVLTGDNQKNALEFLYNHNASYLLIDSSDIGKYGAFSSIGSDENYDRYSWIGVFLLDERQTQETKNQTIYIYPGGVSLDEDLIINENGKQILLPGQKAEVGAIILAMEKESGDFGQPYIIVVYQGRQYKINLRYLYINGRFMDFGSGINATVYIFPRLIQQGQGISKNPIGAAMFLSPRLMRGLLTQIYILDDPFNKFSNFKLAHTEPNLIIESLRNQGLDLPEFVYFQGVQGPIKIWEIKYTGDEKIKQEYLDTDASKYLSWEL